MNTVEWVILLVLGVPLLGLVVWVVVSASLVRIPPGRLGLALSRGRPTDTALPSGLQVVSALRRRTVQIHPSTETALRADSEPDSGTMSWIGARLLAQWFWVTRPKPWQSHGLVWLIDSRSATRGA